MMVPKVPGTTLPKKGFLMANSDEYRIIVTDMCGFDRAGIRRYKAYIETKIRFTSGWGYMWVIPADSYRNGTTEQVCTFWAKSKMEAYDMALSALRQHLYFKSLTDDEKECILHPEIRVFPVTDEDLQFKNGVPG